MMTMSDVGQNPGPDLENPTPTSVAAAAPAPPAPTRSKWKILMFGTSLVAVIAIAVSLGVILPRNNNTAKVTSNPSKSEGDASNDMLNLIDPDGGTTTESSEPVTTTTSATTTNSGSSSSAMTTESATTTVPTTTIPNTTPKTTTQSSETTTQSSETTPAPPTTQSGLTAQYIQSNGPLEAKVRMIDPTAVNSYDSCDALKDDIINALKYFANSIIVREVENDWWSKCNPDDPNWNPWGGNGNYFPPVAAYDGAAGIETVAAESSVPQASVGSAGRVEEDSYGTNNQVVGVDEADIVKSDGVHVFAAYGDLLYAWDATNGTTGTSVTPMPYNKTNCTPSIIEPFHHYYYDYAEELDENSTDDTTVYAIEDMGTSSSSNSGKNRRRQQQQQQRKRRDMSMPYYPRPCHQPKPQIVSLLLHETRLTAIVSESNYNYEPYDADKKPSLLSDHSTLTIRVYDVSTVPDDGSPLTLIGERKLKGNYDAARSINSTGVVVTTSYVNTYAMATSLYRSQPLYCGLNNTEYEEKASKIALNRSDFFAEQLISELDLGYGCDHIFQISAMQSGATTDNTNGDLLSQFVSVVSFDIASASYANDEIPVELSGSFSSGWLSSVYVSQDFVAALAVGSYYNQNTTDWDQSTFILGFDISNPTPVPYSFAQVPGSPINEYAADLYDGHFRIATTDWSWSAAEGSRIENKIFVLELPDKSATNSSEMKRVGETDHLGKPDESIYSVRFISDKGYIVTFERIDPFIVVDLSNVTYPHPVGELELPGYSSYLHPIEIDGVSLMLGVGQEVNETTGWTTGVKISLFNITDPENPVETVSYIDEDAYSNAEHDFKSFRYLTLNQKLILPQSEYTWGADGNFDGFIVYDVAIDKIKQSHNISHASSSDIYGGCWYNAYMSPRSLVFKSKVTTILSHTVLSTDLDDGTLEWKLNLDKDLNKTKDDCWGYFRGYF